MSDPDEIRQEQKNLAVSVQQFIEALRTIKNMQIEYSKQLQQTRDALEKLAALDDLEFIEALNDWVSKKKWHDLKKDPR